MPVITVWPPHTKLLLLSIAVMVLLPRSVFSDVTLDAAYIAGSTEQCYNFGLSADWPISVSDRLDLTLGYTATFTHSSIYCGIGPLWGAALFAAATKEDADLMESAGYEDDEDSTNPLATLGILLILLPENIALRYRLGSELYVVFSFHPYSIEYSWVLDRLDHFSGVGFRFRMVLGTWVVFTPYTMARYNYDQGAFSLSSGLSIGYAY
jgi:hypothetical protein